jgi:hypothetical protein
VRLYRAFASNNSGDTVLVARFRSAREPVSLAETLAELDPEGDRDGWRAFLREEGCAPEALDVDLEAAAAGRALLATGYDAYDALPGVRELVTRRGALIVYTAVHLHEAPPLLVGLGGVGPDDAVRDALFGAGAGEVVRHGDALFATLAGGMGGGWAEALGGARSIAEGAGAPFAAELVAPHEERLVEAVRADVPAPSERGHLLVGFVRAEDAARFARRLDGSASRGGRSVLVDVARARPRLALRALEARGLPRWTPRGELEVIGHFFRADYRAAEVRPKAVLDALRRTGTEADAATVRSSYRSAIATLVTDTPHPVVRALGRAAELLRVELSVGLRPTKPLARALTRVRADLRVVDR